MYLSGDVKLWCRNRIKDDLSAGHPKIETWERLKKELKEQFLPNNTSWLARDDLKKLKQDKSPWAQAELRRQNVKDLSSAIAAADSLVNFKTVTRDGSVAVPSRFKTRDKRDERRKTKKFGGGGYKPGFDKGKGKQADVQQSRDSNKPNAGCFICGGPHYARECPKKERLNAILVGDSEQEEIVTHINPMRVLNCLVAEMQDSVAESSLVETDLAQIDVLQQGKSGAVDTLMYVKIRVNDREIVAMLDSGATNTFVADRLVTQLGLRLSNIQTSMKAVNAKAQRILGMAYGVSVVLDKWQGKQDLFVVTLDDFDVILGLDFLKKAKIALMPHLNGILLANELCPCHKALMAESRKEGSSLVSAIAINKALKKGGEVFLAVTATEESEQAGSVPDAIFVVKTDNLANTFFKTQKKLLQRQARWQEFLAEYDFTWEHKPGQHNQVADALSRREVLASLIAKDHVEFDMLDRLRQAAMEDAAYVKIVNLVQEGTVRRYCLDNGLLYAKGDRVYVPTGKLRKHLLTETHDPHLRRRARQQVAARHYACAGAACVGSADCGNEYNGLGIRLDSLVCWVADQGSYLGAVTRELRGSGLSLNVLSIMGETVKGQFCL
uniref:Retrotransposon gag domain-containing protein n=1 Tax=Populus alba TaxID=43335 RepID=A0A4U5MWH7_POPAL|nr:hypothetical protein D5086_0000296720 [Populus alba]